MSDGDSREKRISPNMSFVFSYFIVLLPSHSKILASSEMSNLLIPFTSQPPKHTPQMQSASSIGDIAP
jgi:hypothetical protein